MGKLCRPILINECYGIIGTVVNSITVLNIDAYVRDFSSTYICNYIYKLVFKFGENWI